MRNWSAEAGTGIYSTTFMSHYQQPQSPELHASTSLARMWQSQGKRQEAYELLQPVYNWFTEEFDTADLKDAKALLEGLGR